MTLPNGSNYKLILNHLHGAGRQVKQGQGKIHHIGSGVVQITVKNVYSIIVQAKFDGTNLYFYIIMCIEEVYYLS